MLLHSSPETWRHEPPDIRTQGEILINKAVFRGEAWSSRLIVKLACTILVLADCRSSKHWFSSVVPRQTAFKGEIFGLIMI
jgi:hypothetical protein